MGCDGGLGEGPRHNPGDQAEAAVPELQASHSGPGLQNFPQKASPSHADATATCSASLYFPLLTIR